MSWTTVFLAVNVFIMFLADVMLVIVYVIESKPVDTFHRCAVCMCVCVCVGQPVEGEDTKHYTKVQECCYL